VTFTVPPGATREQADTVTSVISPAVVRAGDELIVAGSGLDAAAFVQVYLRTPGVGGVERPVTDWRRNPAPPERVSPAELRLHFPDTVGIPPDASPAPGVYLLAVGSDAPSVVRSNTTPISVAARIDDVTTPPVLTPDGAGFYQVRGVGFTTSLTEVFLDTVPLTRVSSAPGPGQFQVDRGETSFRFRLPARLQSGRYYLRVRVNQIDSPPSWYINV
jgi:hypothetical protein